MSDAGRLTLAEWLANPESIIDGVFAADGPLARQFENYKVNKTQIAYAKTLALAVTRGATSPGLVTPVEAGTGTGKTLAILIVLPIDQRPSRSRADRYFQQHSRR